MCSGLPRTLQTHLGQLLHKHTLQCFKNRHICFLLNGLLGMLAAVAYTVPLYVLASNLLQWFFILTDSSVYSVLVSAHDSPFHACSECRVDSRQLEKSNLTQKNLNYKALFLWKNQIFCGCLIRLAL